MLTDYRGASLWEADIAARVGRIPRHQCVVFGFEVDLAEPDQVRLTRRPYSVQDVQADITFLCPGIDPASRACRAWAALANADVLPSRGLIISAPRAVWLRMTDDDLLARGSDGVRPRRVGFGRAVLRDQDWDLAVCREMHFHQAGATRGPLRPAPSAFAVAAA